MKISTINTDYLNKPELLEILKNPLNKFFGFYTQICFDIRYKEAKHDLSSHLENAQYWAIKLQQYPAAFMKSAIDAINLSSELVSKWLGSCMFVSVNFDAYGSNSLIGRKIDAYESAMPAADGLFE